MVRITASAFPIVKADMLVLLCLWFFIVLCVCSILLIVLYVAQLPCCIRRLSEDREEQKKHVDSFGKKKDTINSRIECAEWILDTLGVGFGLLSVCLWDQKKILHPEKIMKKIKKK